MTEQDAYRILGIAPESSAHEVKKRYRQLMQQVHPDNGDAGKQSYIYDAQEINSAYAVILKAGKTATPVGKKRKTKQKKQAASWDAPVNENAYCEREILHGVEDEDGATIGTVCVARGKYLWKTEEDFPLFLLSVYRCGKQLLDEVDEALQRREHTVARQMLQPELTYLLAQQYIYGTELIQELARVEQTTEGKNVYYLSSMLEWTGRKQTLPLGEPLYPARMEKHRLYLQNQKGRELGYLSFTDDRLYYIVIPLLEHRRAQVRIEIAEKTSRYQRLHLWLRLTEQDGNASPENLNLQIEQLLESYRNLH